MGWGDEIIMLSSSTTMKLLRESNHVVAADMVAPGGAKRNPGFRNAGSSPSAVVF